MKKILVFEDSSGSMKVLGKMSVLQLIHKTIVMNKDIYSAFKDYDFEFQKWDGSFEKLSALLAKTTEPFIITTDGFFNGGTLSDLGKINRNGCVILIGSDSIDMKISDCIKTFKARDILAGIEHVCR